jgi:hypothetical protein
MNAFSINPWVMTAGLAALVVLCALVVWLLVRKRPTEAELERKRRDLLVQMGRLLDGMLLDICEMQSEDGRTLEFLQFSYRIGGVDYECSQEITDMQDVVKAEDVRAGFPCSVRYQPGNPQNSIVVAETWSGLREGLPQLPLFEDPDPIDTSHLRRR